MAQGQWTLDDIPWDRFDVSKVNSEMIKVIKAASLVEYNGDDYATYLCNVFDDDEEFQAAARQWASEEVQHGEALGRWAQIADPDFDFQGAVKRFRDSYRIPVEATESSRGSRSGELVSRCIVEVGTSSYYGSLAKATEEPVLKDICQKIAGDELRHYKLFYDHLRRYVSEERISKLRRLMVCAGRINETEDDELAYAYYCANAPADEPYNRKKWSEAYMARACGFYDRKHIDRGAAMIAKAAGINPQNRIVPLFSKMAYGMMRWKHARYKGEGAEAA